MKNITKLAYFALVVGIAVLQSCDSTISENQLIEIKDFSFDYRISEEVLKNYLSRSITLSFLTVSSNNPESDIQMIINTGAKYISRANLPWQAETEYTNSIAIYKEKINEIHSQDSDIIFESAIFETVWKSCEMTPIPDWVFIAFNEPVLKRNFSYSKMLFPSGKYVDFWGDGGSVPDITQLETQMYFYYRACKYIDAGFEAIHWGQVMLIGENDTDYQDFHKVFKIVRQYASKHARRHFILFNGHTHGIIDPDGKLLFDFHSYPLRIKTMNGEKPHATSELNPQRVIFEVNYVDAIYTKSLGGTTVSGWDCTTLPYFVEIDNYGGYQKGSLNKPGVDYWPWGMDEISWFVNQPSSYRTSWLQEAYSWVRNTDQAGFLCMPGSRPFYSIKKDKIIWYYANSNEFNDENAIKFVWSNVNDLIDI